MRNVAIIAGLILCLTAARPSMRQDSPAADPSPLTPQMKQDVLNEVADLLKSRAFVPGVDLSKWPEFLSRQRGDIDGSTRDAVFTASVNAALENFGISHIRLLSRRAAEARSKANAAGAGLIARSDGNGLKVAVVFPGSPASDAGIQVGDVITAIDGKPPEATSSLAGAAGTDVTLKVHHGSSDDKEVRIVRREYSTVFPETLERPNASTMVLSVRTFGMGYGAARIQGMVKEAAIAKYLVLDLRSNSGGTTTNLRHLLSLLLPPDTEVGTFVSRLTAQAYADSHNGRQESNPILLAESSSFQFTTHRIPDFEPIKARIAVLVNRGTASAAEICAEALRDSLHAPIIGTPTSGQVLASEFRKLPHGFEIQYPTEDYVTKNGMRLEGTPILPDVQVTARLGDVNDPSVARAVEELKKG